MGGGGGVANRMLRVNVCREEMLDTCSVNVCAAMRACQCDAHCVCWVGVLMRAGVACPNGRGGCVRRNVPPLKHAGNRIKVRVRSL